jgi:hypothetical protein
MLCLEEVFSVITRFELYLHSIPSSKEYFPI